MIELISALGATTTQLSSGLDFADRFSELRIAHDQAYWAASAALAAWLLGFISLIVNGTGIYLVWGQLRANREALRTASTSAEAAAEAARIAFQQARPWMKLSMAHNQAEIWFNPGELERPQLTVHVHFENVGQTPALTHMLVARGIRDPHLDNGASLRAVWQELLSTGWNPQTAIFPGEARQMGCGTWLPWPENVDTANFAVLVASLYKSAMEDPWHGTPLVVQLHGPQPTGQPVRAPPGQTRQVTLTTHHDYGTYPV